MTETETQKSNAFLQNGQEIIKKSQHNESEINDLLSHDYSNMKPKRDLKKVQKMVSIIKDSKICSRYNK